MSVRKTPAKEAPSVGAVVNAIAILRQVAFQPTPLGVNALARAAGVSPSTCYNIVKTLTAEGMLEFDAVSKTYTAGSLLLSLGLRGAEGRRAFARCAFLLEPFAEAQGATVVLWQVTSQRLVLIGLAESGAATRIHMTAGFRLPLLAGAGGRCVAFALPVPKSTIEAQFPQLRWDNPPTLEKYLREVEQSRRRGWALDDGDLFSGISTVSVPLLDQHGRPAFILATSFFRGQRSKAELAKVGAALKALAPRVTAAIAV
ncbi:IclR family transcriptional regulator [Phenylobacterium sp. VNQ135]|uniref:IclR family transcriptional regulator n=1 Tax=Phenylobacterium sp. VNQ135 TaxID=3400922 RepID=UPI003C0D0BC3